MAYDFAGRTPIFCDVDGTLLFWPCEDPGRIPREGEPGYGQPPTVNVELVAALRRAVADGAALVIWSHNGAEHARSAAQRCGIDHLADAILAKPRVMIDDEFRWIENQKKTLRVQA